MERMKVVIGKSHPFVQNINIKRQTLITDEQE